MYIYMCVYVYVYIYMCVCMYVYIYTYVYLYIHMCMILYAYIYNNYDHWKKPAKILSYHILDITRYVYLHILICPATPDYIMSYLAVIAVIIIMGNSRG